MSRPQAANCVEEFATIISNLYGDEYLCSPSAEELKQIVKLHKEVHKIVDMFSSLDCMHTRWKNYPKVWQGAYQTGRYSPGPTAALEALCEYHLWFWHASFGYAGSLNDLNILNLTLFLDSLLDGSFEKMEEDANIVPFKIGDDVLNQLYVLVDGIYPRYSRFVKGLNSPITPQ